MDKPKVFIIEIWSVSLEEWLRSIDFPNYYTDDEANVILAGNPKIAYRKREIEYV